ncbi:ParA family protein [Georgenia sp. Z1344]|uniref:ParA family protein n=1 Tax=Georgenia sp. Z1344 TaxID=3416706 RepID=UPI003CEF1E76
MTSTSGSDRQVLALSHAGTTAFGTTTAVALALEAARAGEEVLLIDLSPDGEATRWLQAEPWEEGQDVGAILDDDYPLGWARSLAVPTTDHERLRLVPASSGPAREPRAGAGPQLHHALTTADDYVLVVIDCGRIRSGARLVTALNAASDVVVTTTRSPKDLAEVSNIVASVEAYRRLIHDEGGNRSDLVRLRGVVVGAPAGGPAENASSTEEPELAEVPTDKAWSPLVLSPHVPVVPAEHGEPATRKRPFEIWTPGSTLSQHYGQLAAQLVDAMSDASTDD